MKIATRNTSELSIPPDRIKAINPEGDSPTPLDSILILQGELRNYGMPVINSDTSITLIATLTNSKGDEIKLVDTVKYLNRTYLFLSSIQLVNLQKNISLMLLLILKEK